ncbi:MAG: CheR family methyltransferase, partial [Bacteroidota bacterium]|nr:CheR family methyltransferase [Bacteroidota bacterium]
MVTSINPLSKTFDISDSEKAELLQIIHNRYEFDFTGYSEASLKRRINRFADLKNMNNFFELKNGLLNNESLFFDFVQEVTVNVTEMFRDPSFYKAVKEKIFPYLETHPYFKIWHAGCSSGEEPYSMAIMLKENNLLDNARIYATDLNQNVLSQAREAIYPARYFQEYSQNYINAGGKNSLADYYVTNSGMVKLDQQLSRNMVFSSHNLVVDRSFNEFHLIVCRNVLIYFKQPLQEKVFQ